MRHLLLTAALLLPAHAFADAFSSTPPPPALSGVASQYYNGTGVFSVPSGAGSTGNIVGSGATVVGHAVCWNNTSATAAIDCGIIPLGTTGNGSGLTGLVFSQIGSTPTTLAGYGITNGATNGANANITSLSGLTTPLSVGQGGTGTATPGLVAGTNVTITGSWPNQTVNSSGGGSLTLTDGSHTVTGTTQITVTGATVGGSTPNGTLTISASASSFTPGTTTILDATAPCFLVNSTSTTSACDVLGTGVVTAAANAVNTSGGLLTSAVADGQTIVFASNKLSTTASTRTAASPTVVTTDMGGTVFIASGGITFPLISTGLFDNKQTLLAVNYGGSPSAVTNSTGQTINSSGGCVSASGIPAGGAWQMQPNGTSIDCQQVISVAPATPLGTTGTTATLVAPRAYEVCTTTCTITVPVPAAGFEFCVLNDDNVSTVITMAAIGSSARYENTARTAYGTAGTGTFVSGGAVGDKVCIVGRDATHYLTASFTGSWTAN